MHERKSASLWLLILLLGWAEGCAPILVGPEEPNSSLIIGRILIDNKRFGRYGVMPVGVIDHGIEVEGESWDGSDSFKVVTGQDGYFFLPNIRPNTYYVRGVVVERRRADQIESLKLPVRALTFTPVPGKVGITATLNLEISEEGYLQAKEARQDEEAKARFFEKHPGSTWASREFVSIGTRPILGAQLARADLPNQVSIPLQRRGQLLFVQVTLNDRVSGSFIVDTGASGTMISRAMAERLGIDLKKKHPTVTVRTPGGMITVPLVALDSIDVGGMKVTDITVSVHDAFPDPTIAGLLGLNFLNYFGMRVDNTKGLLVLEGKTEPASERMAPGPEQKATPTAGSTRVGSPRLKAERPEWQTGYEWRYAWKTPGGSGTLTREIVREDTFQGVPAYVMRTGRNESFYTKDILGLLGTMAKGRLVTRNSAPYQVFSWPLEVGKEWRNTYTRENIPDKSSQNFDFRMVVTGVEEVTVPAGSFETLKVEVYLIPGGNLLVEYWYSPKAKWNVKSRTYLPGGIREEELISFKVD